jgi:hypothetical protein
MIALNLFIGGTQNPFTALANADAPPHARRPPNRIAGQLLEFCVAGKPAEEIGGSNFQEEISNG